jgi:hypothetical protein
VSTGWIVTLKSENQATIYQEKSLILQAMMGETTKGLMKLNMFQCKVPKLLELTKIKTKVDAKGSKTLHKLYGSLHNTTATDVSDH